MDNVDFEWLGCSLSTAHICALQACTHVLQVAVIESVVLEIDITARVQIDMTGLACLERITVDNITTLMDYFVFCVVCRIHGRFPNICCAIGHLSSLPCER